MDELYSLKTKQVFRRANAKLIKIDGVMVLATPAGEPLVTRVR